MMEGQLCNIDDSTLLSSTASTIEECADLCYGATGCKYFAYGTGENPQCIQKDNSIDDCSAGLVEAEFNFYHINTTLNWYLIK
jgi:hypothetical protein